jgi:aquaporin related protein
MMVCGALPVMRGLFLIPAQLIGGIVAAGLVSCMLPGPLAVITTLSNGTSITQGLFIEMFLTTLLVFTILMLATEKSGATPIAPVGIGLALFIAELGKDP